MDKSHFKAILVFVGLSSLTNITKLESCAVVINNTVTSTDKQTHHVYKKVLENGLTILVRPLHTIPKVCTQLWYKVGSKNEKTHEKGIAHLIEHMVFKGTSGQDSLNLSESDINVMVHMLSGTCNAFTSYDYTGYLFNFPTQHWKTSLAIVSDCMRNCSFKDEHLNSEMKAVIQELKMYRDNYVSFLVDEMLSVIFAGHPYHDPVIGYKHNLWSFHANNLRDFYNKHYVPNNATLVVVGDVNPEEVFEAAQQYFGAIPADYSYRPEQFHFSTDIISKKVTLYRDIQQPIAASLFIVPGTRDASDSAVDVLTWVLGHGKGSRLQRKIVDQLQLATSLAVFHVDLFEQGLFAVLFEPKHAEDVAKINALITQEIEDICTYGFKQGELERAVKNAKIRLYDTFEDLQQQATDIGKYYLATGNPEYIFSYLNEPVDEIGKKAQQICCKYLRSAIMHEGIILPISEREKTEWVALQEQSDQEDKQILLAHIRTSPVEPPIYSKQVQIEAPVAFKFPKAIKTNLSNGIALLTGHNETTPKIDVIIDFKAKYFYDPENLPGVCNFMNRMFTEGTKNYTADQLADAFESRAISFKSFPGGISMSLLRDDLHYGFMLLKEILTNVTFDERAIAKVANQLLADVKTFWDEPNSFAGQLIKEIVYKGHPYSKDILGTQESIPAITRDDLINFYQKYITPKETRVVVVGNIKDIDVQAIVNDTIGSWQGPEVADMVFPQLPKIKEHDVDFPIARDQVVLCLAGLSVARTDPDYDKLFLFDQIFGTGVLGSMASRLFQLREQSGLFYTISGSVTVQANEQPGLAMVKTIVSLDRLAEAEALIKKTIDEVPDSLQEYELEESKRAVVNALINNFETNIGAARSFLFLDRYGYAPDFFDNRGAMLAPITLDQVKEAAKKILAHKRMVTLRVGRV